LVGYICAVYALLAKSIIIFTDARHPIKISKINANMGGLTEYFAKSVSKFIIEF
jgi:hypothetical protein